MIEIIILLLTGCAIGEIARWMWTNGMKVNAVAFSAFALALVMSLA